MARGGATYAIVTWLFISGRRTYAMVNYWLLCLLACVLCARSAVENLDVQTFPNGSFTINVGGKQWFRSGSVGVRDMGQWWSQDEDSLQLTGHSTTTGSDKIGTFTVNQYDWKATGGASSIEVQTYVNIYNEVPAVEFGLAFVNEATNTNTSEYPNSTISSFPSFVIEEGPVERGFMTWSGNMARFIKIGKWSPGTGVYGGVDGGFPLVVFDSVMENAVVLSPSSDFMSANQATFKNDKTGESTLTFGPLSSITEIPNGYLVSTILVAGNNVTDSMMKFGEILRIMYGKDDGYRRSDFSINYLGYWTDNGACYYYDTGNFSNYEEVLDAVVADAEHSDIPYRYLQIDSWWYFKGPMDGVKNWTATPSAFPNGIQAVVNKTGLPIVAHNRWWSPETDYAKHNGGDYDFIVEPLAAVPVEQAFWDFLLSSSKRTWNLLVYEQDWLYVEYGRLLSMRNSTGLGRMWLRQMGESARRYGLTIQYCMPWPRHLLQSVEISTVTQTRVSDDYQPGNTQWQIGDTTILAHSLGLAAFKDNFHTAVVESGCHNRQNESAPALETYVAALSGGPVGPSDHIKLANRTLIMATCMVDGRLLKPSRPVMSLESSFLQRAFGSPGPNGQLWAAYTEVAQWTWYYIIAGELFSSYTMHASELPPSRHTKPKTAFPKSLAFTYTLDGQVTNAMMFTGTLSFPTITTTDFQYWSLAPILNNGWALLGELDKIIPISETRITNILNVGMDYLVSVAGVEGEKVSITAYDTASSKAVAYACTISPTGQNTLYLPGGPCVAS